MKFYRWLQESGGAEPELYTWYLSIKLDTHNEWDLRAGRYIDDWDSNTMAYYEGQAERSDFPMTSPDLPVYSPRLKELMEQVVVSGIQYLPLRITHRDNRNEASGYHIANYLNKVDCLNRKHSRYQIWTEDNLLFWEKRPRMLGTFRDVTHMVLNANQISNLQLFRLWGWEITAVVREDIKQAIENAKITGCRFIEIPVT